MITVSPVDREHTPVLGSVYGPRWYVGVPFAQRYTISGTVGTTHHTGNDTQLPYNEDFHKSVYAPRDMLIEKVEIGRGKTWGWLIVGSGIDELGKPFKARFAHVENIKVKPGDKVLAGAVLCAIGDANGFYKGSGAHLHIDFSYTDILYNDPSYWPGNDLTNLYKHFVDPQEFLTFQVLIAAGTYKHDTTRVKLSATPNLRVRLKASLDNTVNGNVANVIGSKPPGATLEILTPPINGFYKLAGESGYVSALFTTQEVPLPTTYTTRYVTANYLNVRSEPRESADTLYNPRVYLEYGAEIQVNLADPVNGFVQMPNLRWVSRSYLTAEKPPPRSIPSQPSTIPDSRAKRAGIGLHIMPGYTINGTYPIIKSVDDTGVLIAARNKSADSVFVMRKFYDTTTQGNRIEEMARSGIEAAYNHWFQDNEGIVSAVGNFAHLESYNEMYKFSDLYLAFEAYRARRLWHDHKVKSMLLNIGAGQTDRAFWIRAKDMVSAALETGSLIGVHAYSEGVISANNGPYWNQDGTWSGGSPFPATLDPAQCHTAFRVLQDKRDLQTQGQGAAILVATEWGMDDMTGGDSKNGVYKPFGIQTRGWKSCWPVWERMGWSGPNTGKSHWQFYQEQMRYWATMTKCLGVVYTDGTGGDRQWDDFDVSGYM